MTVTERADARHITAHDPRLDPWRAFLTAHARITRRLDEELRAEHDLSLAEYDALLTIADAPDRRIRMRQLADRVILSKGHAGAGVYAARFQDQVAAGTRRRYFALVTPPLVPDVAVRQVPRAYATPVWAPAGQPDIVIVEGLNVLQAPPPAALAQSQLYASDFFDFSIYVDAEEAIIQDWYVSRFFKLRETVFRDPSSYFHRYSAIDDEQARQVASTIWREINGKNLRENIVTTRPRADLVLVKGAEHLVQEVLLKRT